MFNGKIQNCECENLMATNNHKTHIDGTFYNLPELPVVLHDKNGCVFLNQEKYDLCVQSKIISESLGGKVAKINVKPGISRINGYKICPFGDAKKCPKYTGRK